MSTEPCADQLLQISGPSPTTIGFGFLSRKTEQNNNIPTADMAQSKPRMPPQKPDSVHQPLPAAQDELSDAFEGLDSDDPMEKDETEVELEKLVFGDDAGFREALNSYNEGASPTKLEANAEDHQNAAQVSDGEQGLQGVDDADVRNLVMLLAPSNKILIGALALFSRFCTFGEFEYRPGAGANLRRR